MKFFKQHILSLSLLTWGLAALVSCKKTDNPAPVVSPSLSNLTVNVWVFDQASAVGGGYQLDFKRGQTDDPFGLATVRVKFNDDGTISGTDNTGGPIKDGTWKLLSNGQKITVSGTKVFGIDGTSAIDKLDATNLMISNVLNVPQVGTVSIKGVLVHE